jgi:hypothetical protein
VVLVVFGELWRTKSKQSKDQKNERIPYQFVHDRFLIWFKIIGFESSKAYF